VWMETLSSWKTTTFTNNVQTMECT
jgi:hypothetical protein